ncbi:MAG TPA: sugar phosphate isomerase/epimerase family protein [Tepidisphaeraceae bacterium]|nr:sugar phosphate isomerase/epimerase family protein [Tepidisphaeraceae bacterium]
MRFGICTTVDNSAPALSAGWDFIEESVQGLLKGLEPDEQWTGHERAGRAALPIRAANMLVPGSLKITGPDVNTEQLGSYIRTVLRRADALDIRTLVFGSGAARHVPEGFARDTAAEQITEFMRASAAVAMEHGVTIVVEPLHRGECNIINFLAEAMKYVDAVNHPNLQCLVDSYHLWMEDEPLENLRVAMPSIRHVHVADRVGRTAPGESGEADYRPFFRVLKDGGYDGLISVEAKSFDIASNGRKVLEFLRTQWDAA